jgi:hypothetical protein
MADELPTFQFEDVPLDEARRMGRGPRMEPMLYDTLRQKIQSLSSKATRIHLGLNIEKLSYGATPDYSAYQSHFWGASRRITLPKMMPRAHVRMPWKSAW